MITLVCLIGGVLVMLVTAIAAVSYFSQKPDLELPVRAPVKILDRLTDVAALEKKLAGAPSSQSIRVDREQVKALMKEEVYGQEPVIDDAVEQVWASFAADKREEPVGVFLLVGPPGSAKSRFGKSLGRALYGPQGAEIFNMSEFSGAHTGSGLFGAAPDHQGGQGSLSTYLLANPKSVVVLDEFEKAHKEVQRKFLGPFDDGVFTDQKTLKKVSTTDTIFVITTNALEDQIARLAVALAGDRDELETRVREILKGEIENSILSRIDYVFVYQPMQSKPFAAMVARFMEDFATRYSIKLIQIDDEVLYQYVVKHHRDKVDGRQIKKVVEKDVRASFIALKEAGKTSAKITWSTKTKSMTIAAAT